MRILHILDHSLPKHSGYVFRTMSIMAEQKKRGWTPLLLTTPRHGPSAVTEEQVENWTFNRTPNSGLAAKLPAGLKDWIEMRLTEKHLKEVIPELKPDILHAHSPVLNFFPSYKARLGLPIVYEVRAFWEDAAVDHGTTSEGSLRYKISRSMETEAFRKATAITTICEGLRSDIAGRGINPEKITVIPNAVNIDEFPLLDGKDQPLENELGLRGKTVLGFAGSFYAYEGLVFLMEALPSLIEKMPNICVLLVGGGPTEGKIRSTIKKLGLQDHVILTGRVPHSDVRRYYSLADIMVYPRHSIRLTETVTPLKPLEAMAMGRLVLASDIGGHRELIEDGKTGRLFKADDPQSLEQTCTDLIEKRADWPAMLAAGRHYVEHDRNWHNSVARYEAVYNRCLSG